ARHARGRSSPARLPDSLAAFEPRIIAPRYLGHASDEMRFHDMISYIRHEVNSLRRGTRGKFGASAPEGDRPRKNGPCDPKIARPARRSVGESVRRGPGCPPYPSGAAC